jgi:hypothetical protein
MKKGWLLFGAFASLISFISFASAQSVISDIFAGIDAATITLAILFVIFFTVIFFSTSKIFKGNKAVPVVLSLAISLLIIYWINQSANVGGLLTGIGLSGDNLYTVGTVFIIAFTIFLFVKIRAKALLVLGGGLIAIGLSGLVYAGSTLVIIGIILALIGIFFVFKKKRGIPPGVGKKPRLEFEFSGPRQNWVSRKKAAANRAAEEAEILKRRLEAEKKQLGPERDLAARAQAMAVANADYIQHEARREASVEALEKEKEAQVAQEQQQEQGLQNQVGAYLDSLRQSFQKLQEEYNALLRINPQDPHVKDIYNQLSAVRSEIQRVMQNNKIRYKD